MVTGLVGACDALIVKLAAVPSVTAEPACTDSFGVVGLCP